jgi:hypothetical protein
MAQSIDILLDTTQPLTDLAQTLNKLLDIDLQPALVGGKTYYAFRAMTLTFDLVEFAPTNGAGANVENYRYHISINGIFGSEHQRKKWTEDWAFGVMQTLKAHKYRLKRVDKL